jgi:hypothetical protein
MYVRHSKSKQKRDFWFENKPSGNPAGLFWKNGGGQNGCIIVSPMEHDQWKRLTSRIWGGVKIKKMGPSQENRPLPYRDGIWDRFTEARFRKEQCDIEPWRPGTVAIPLKLKIVGQGPATQGNQMNFNRCLWLMYQPSVLLNRKNL